MDGLRSRIGFPLFAMVVLGALAVRAAPAVVNPDIGPDWSIRLQAQVLLPN